MKTLSPAVSVLTLGCRVNQYESDALSDELRRKGASLVPFGEPADVAVVNTCSVTAESDRKSRQMIRRAAQNAVCVVVTGCYAQTESDAILSMPGVRYVCGNDGKAALADVILALAGGNDDLPKNAVSPPGTRACVETTLTVPQRTRSYIKIEDGCPNRCAYCRIRFARGPVRSKLPSDALAEAQALACAGAKEIILTGIEAASYGMDFPDRKPYGYALADLILEIGKIDGIRRIGLGSLEPTVMSEYFVSAAASCDKLLPHFHLSIQSGSDRVLRAMRRRYTAAAALAAVERMKKALPDATFSADVIVGFPGEEEADYLETEAFCRAVGFLHLHVFPFSRRAGTEAAEMENQVPEAVRRERAERLGALDEALRAGFCSRYADAHREKPVFLLVEKNGGGLCSGHSEHFVEIKKVRTKAEVGEIVPVVLTGTDGNVCFGERIAHD
ncbi:MAG: tRNA (N(6)-L-threonylcarbamoyladenosine(37)-C(2))-methylthiotransferase MtaB [Clostridia bacterium]|nr:tRNA (N(6)-L-threonylcarbamoyladenosine(37)-C(2))-methylthiotransferase MtaB [Clostridia bacterium]